jgi:hypothetical protein
MAQSRKYRGKNAIMILEPFLIPSDIATLLLQQDNRELD